MIVTGFATGLVIAGVGILVAALVRLQELLRELPTGQVRRRWHFLTGLVLVFIAGYIIYAVVFWGQAHTGADLIVPVIFFFGAGFVWLTVTLALQTAVDVRRVTLLEQETVTDTLIGIYNRRYLDRRLAEEFERAQRYARPLSVLMLDIDHFKLINDTYGHPVGDQVLHYLGDLILNMVRSSDIVARYGGEEILVIAPDTSLPAAFTLAERMRQSIETHELVVTSGPNPRIKVRFTVSLGAACLAPGIESAQVLLQHADEALYEAKRGGRNRVAAYDIYKSSAGYS